MVHAPFSDGARNDRYFKLVFSMVVGLYVMELIAIPELEWIQWIHHGATLLGACLFSGAIHWLSLGGLELFSCSAIIIWFFQSLNSLIYAGLVGYHTSRCP